MRLTALTPRWVTNVRTPDGSRVGLSFDCPHCSAIGVPIPERIHVFFTPPIDGGVNLAGERAWQRTAGSDFETLSLFPSIDFRHGVGMHWHGWITNGEVTNADLQT